MNTRQALAHISNLLKSHNIEDPGEEARILICHATGSSPAILFASPETVLTDSQQEKIEEFASRRIKHEPSAYITGNKEFFGLNYYVNKNVLIPRPETEILVEQAILAAKQLVSMDKKNKLRIADIGTGCGAVTISIAKNFDAEFYAIDLSIEALEVAAYNCERHGVSGRIQLLQSNLLEAAPGSLDIIVANLPYISKDEMKTLSPEILLYEPLQALDGGEDGTEKIEELLRTCKPHLGRQASIILEFGYQQKKRISRLIDRYLPGSCSTFFHDLAGLDRSVSIIV
jgi:release factor glutamine methyltransferase